MYFCSSRDWICWCLFIAYQQDYVKDPDRRFAADTVAAISLCAQRLPKVAHTCLEGLLALVTPSKSPTFLWCMICRRITCFWSFNISVNSAGSSNSDFGSLDGEAVVLIQAIVSINAIIRLDPPSYDKVLETFSRFCQVSLLSTQQAPARIRISLKHEER